MTYSSLYEKGIAQRADKLFDEHRQLIFKQTDRQFACLMVIQWLFGVFAALYISPKTWIGMHSQTHLHVWMALFLGAAISSLPIVLVLHFPGKPITRHTIAISQMLWSALLIHLTGGRIETHFHVFGSLAFLAFYRDWRVLATATVVIAGDHFLRGMFWPESVFGVALASQWRWLEHAGWVVFEDLILLSACITGVREMKSIALRQGTVEAGESRLQAINDSSPLGVFFAGVEGQVQYINEKWQQITGLSESEGIEEGWINALHPDGKEKVIQNWYDTVNNQEEFETTTRLIHKDGKIVWVHARAAAIRDGSGIQGYVGTVEDITEYKRAEQETRLARREAERANLAKSEFLSRISHELRTPMNSILGFAQLMEMDEISKTQRESVDQILTAGRHLLQLINEVLDISRIEAGELAVSCEPVEVVDVIQEAVNLLQPLADQHNITILSRLANFEGTYIFADRQRLRQVIINLLSNSIKYNLEGGKVSIVCTIPSQELIRISVSDTGIGIPTNKIERLFIPFDRLGASETSVEGTGLGLAVSKRFIEAMGGNLQYETGREFGSCFYFELPTAHSPLKILDQENWSDKNSEETNSTNNKITILYIEDNIPNIQLMERILASRVEISLVSAMLGKEGLNKAIEYRPDLLLLDLDLPDIPGQEVLRIMKDDSNLSSIPVIVVSADATASRVEKLMEAGAVDYLCKPLEIKKLLEIIDSTVARSDKKIA